MPRSASSSRRDPFCISPARPTRKRAARGRTARLTLELQSRPAKLRLLVAYRAPVTRATWDRDDPAAVWRIALDVPVACALAPPAFLPRARNHLVQFPMADLWPLGRR